MNKQIDFETLSTTLSTCMNCPKCDKSTCPIWNSLSDVPGVSEKPTHHFTAEIFDTDDMDASDY